LLIGRFALFEDLLFCAKHLFAEATATKLPLWVPPNRCSDLASAAARVAVKRWPGAKVTLSNRAHHRKDVAGGQRGCNPLNSCRGSP
jgi:hypothetical protein